MSLPRTRQPASGKDIPANYTDFICSEIDGASDAQQDYTDKKVGELRTEVTPTVTWFNSKGKLSAKAWKILTSVGWLFLVTWELVRHYILKW